MQPLHTAVSQSPQSTGMLSCGMVHLPANCHLPPSTLQQRKSLPAGHLWPVLPVRKTWCPKLCADCCCVSSAQRIQTQHTHAHTHVGRVHSSNMCRRRTAVAQQRTCAGPSSFVLGFILVEQNLLRNLFWREGGRTRVQQRYRVKSLSCMRQSECWCMVLHARCCCWLEVPQRAAGEEAPTMPSTVAQAAMFRASPTDCSCATMQ